MCRRVKEDGVWQSGEVLKDIRPVAETGTVLGLEFPSKRIGIDALCLSRLWPLLLPLLILLPGLAAFPFPSGEATYSDFAISHYPNAVYLKQSLLMWRTVPLWSSTILSGYPFAANPLAGLWYLPGWLALAFPLPLGINIAILLHWLLGGVGMVLLLRAEGLDLPAALFGAVVFEAMPKQFAHYGAGHVSLVYAVSWTPWLLLAARAWISHRGQRPNTNLLCRLGWALPSLVMAAIILADVRWSAYAGMLLLGYVITMNLNAGYPGSVGKVKSLLHACLQITGWFVLAALLAAPLLVPLVEYTLLSTRAGLQPADAMIYSLPPGRLLGLLFPDFGGFQEYILYSGVLVFALSILALLCRSSRRGAAFWGVVALFSLLLALGENLPLAQVLTRLPLLGWLRVPSRALYLTGMAMAALSAWGVNALRAAPDPRERKRGMLFLTGLGGFATLLAGLVWLLNASLPASFAWGAAAALAAAAWIGIKLKDRLADGVWITGLFALCLIELMVVDVSLFEPRPAEQVLSVGAPAADFLSKQPGMFRTYSPSYSLPQQTGADFGLQLADGVDPMQLQSYADYMETASGVPKSGYSVALPPFANGDPATANQSYTPDAHMLGLLNVGYVPAEYDLQADGLVLRQRFGETRIYENLLTMPRAWVQAERAGIDGQGQPVERLDWSPNKISLQAEGPGMLVLSEIDYPGWQVVVDGKPGQLREAYGLLRSVDLPVGSHSVDFIYRPASVIAGVGLALIGMLCIVFFALYPLMHTREPQRIENARTLEAGS